MLSWEWNEDGTSGERPRLGRVLVEQGVVNERELELALRTQVETGEPLGKILVDLRLVSRPALDRALAGQSGVQLDEERGFGTGLRAEMERRHSYQRDFRAASA
jgi:hypothetical protein